MIKHLIIGLTLFTLPKRVTTTILIFIALLRTSLYKVVMQTPRKQLKKEPLSEGICFRQTPKRVTNITGVLFSMPSSDINNPYKLASPYEFFIVTTKPGSYHLDGDYTAFGKVIKGMSVVDKINAQPTDDGEWPLKNIKMQVEIVK
jgi:hypothetical protein